jgi:glucokinase
MTWNNATRECDTLAPPSLSLSNGTHRYDVHASEGGMTTFCAASDEEWRLRQFVAARSDNFVNIEGVVSGPGLVNTYDWACAEAGVSSAAADPAAIAALAATGDPQAKRAVSIMVRVFGAGLRNAALHMMSGGGVYIAGGLSVKAGIREEIEASALNHFLDDPHMRGVLATFPLFLVLREDLGLSGALERARRAVASSSA